MEHLNDAPEVIMVNTDSMVHPQCGHPYSSHYWFECPREGDDKDMEMESTTECACRIWASTDLEYLQAKDGRHHPSCDGKGFHINHPQHTAEMMEKIRRPELSLLVLDLGDSCVVKVEKNTCGIHWFDLGTKKIGLGGDGTESNIHAKVVHVLFESFAEVRTAIDALDGEKPKHRRFYVTEDVARCQDVLKFNDMEFARGNDRKELCDQAAKLNYILDAEQAEFAGKPLPIYKPRKGEWKQLGTLPSLIPINNLAPNQDIKSFADVLECVEPLPFKAWRYTLTLEGK